MNFILCTPQFTIVGASMYSNLCSRPYSCQCREASNSISFCTCTGSCALRIGFDLNAWIYDLQCEVADEDNYIQPIPDTPARDFLSARQVGDQSIKCWMMNVYRCPGNCKLKIEQVMCRPLLFENLTDSLQS